MNCGCPYRSKGSTAIQVIGPELVETNTHPAAENAWAAHGRPGENTLERYQMKLICQVLDIKLARELDPFIDLKIFAYREIQDGVGFYKAALDIDLLENLFRELFCKLFFAGIRLQLDAIAAVVSSAKRQP